MNGNLSNIQSHYFNSINSPASLYQRQNYPYQNPQNSLNNSINQQHNFNNENNKQTLTTLSKPGKFFLGNDNILKLNKYGYTREEVYYIMNHIKKIKHLNKLMKEVKRQYQENSCQKIDIVKFILEINNSINKNDQLQNQVKRFDQKENNSHCQVQQQQIKIQSEENKQFFEEYQQILEQKYTIDQQVSSGKRTIAEMIIELWDIEKQESLDFQTRNKLLMEKFYEILKAQEEYYKNIINEKDKIIDQFMKEKQKPYQNQYTNNQYKGPIHKDQPNLFYQLEFRHKLLPKEENIVEKEYVTIRHCGSSIQYQGDIREQRLWNDLELEFKITEKEGGFNVVVFDPPWTLTGFNLDYDTLSDDNWTKSIPIKKLQKSGFIFIWVTNGKLEQALEYLKKNNYKRVDMISWIKMKMNGVLEDGIGFYLRHMFELCIVGAKEIKYEELYKKYKIQNAPNVIISERQQSSRKPDSFYKIVEQLAPNSNYLEIFGRYYNQGPNWVTVGNESINLKPKENTPKEIAKNSKRNGIKKQKDKTRRSSKAIN